MDEEMRQNYTHYILVKSVLNEVCISVSMKVS